MVFFVCGKGMCQKMNYQIKTILSYLGQIAFVLLGISLFTYALIVLAPGDTAKLLLVGNEDRIVSAAEIEAVRHEMWLDRPFLVQYGHWLWNVLHGDLGYSFTSRIPVMTSILDHLGATIILAFTSVAMMLIVSIPAGIYSAVHQNKWFDYLVRLSTFMGISMPGFWVGLMLLWIVGLKLGLVPIINHGTSFTSLILPATTLAIAMASKYTRQVRATVLEELNKEYVVGALARGMGHAYILWKEVLPNAMLPLLTLLGISLGNLLGGAAIVEIVFGWPGLGRLAVEAIRYRDFFLVQGIVLWIALIYMLINILIDISYYFLDPRLSKEQNR